MHSDILLKYYGLSMQSYPYSFIPATDAFVKTIQLGLGYGMVPRVAGSTTTRKWNTC